MSVSTAPGGPNSRYSLDPKDIQLDASRLSTYSHNSSTSGIVLGGVEYPVGARVGKSKQFIIGDPHSFDPHKSFDSVRSSNGSTYASKKDLIETKPIEDKGYRFEEWNWQIIRLCCFIGLVGLMVLLLAITIGVAVEHTIACNRPYKWWQGSVIYSIPVPYYRDSEDTDNVGDFTGLYEKLEYVEYMDFEVISLSHILPSKAPSWELYTSFTGVDPRLGTMDQLSRAIEKARDKLDIKVLLEISLYATSTVHEWYYYSTGIGGSYQNSYENFYVWRDQPEPHSTLFPGGWTHELFRDSYYYHYNDSSRPVLFWSNERVRNKFRDVLKYWLDQGIDGFVMRDMDKMFAYKNSDILTAVKQWRELLDDKSEKYEEKVLMVEEKFLRKIHREDRNLVNKFTKHIDLVEVELRQGNNATYTLKKQIKDGFKFTDRLKDPWTCWKVMGLKDVPPLSRTTTQMLSLMLPGTTMMVAGQETGENFLEDDFDPLIPRAPMLWKLKDVLPYHAGQFFPQNKTTLKALKKVVKERQSELTLRLDSIYDAGDSGKKELNYEFWHLNYKWMVVERTYKRKNAYYYAGNYYTEEVEADMSDISPYGHIVSDNFAKYKGDKNLMEVNLNVGHGVVYLVQH